MDKLGYKEMQNVFKKIAEKAILDKDYRELCLKDSRSAIRRMVDRDVAIPDNIIFLEEDEDRFMNDCIAYILPPYLKESWLLSGQKKGIKT